jgi:hypothetical protein
MAPRKWGFYLKSKSTNYPDHGYHGDPPPTRKIPMVEPGIELGTFMVSSQKLWPPDHEAGQVEIFEDYYQFFLVTLVAALFPKLLLPSLLPPSRQTWLFRTRSVLPFKLSCASTQVSEILSTYTKLFRFSTNSYFVFINKPSWHETCFMLITRKREVLECVIHSELQKQRFKNIRMKYYRSVSF